MALNDDTDILVKIPDNDLPKLLELYEEKAPWAPYISAFVHWAIGWKKSIKHKDMVHFYSPNNSWKEDGTIVAETQDWSHLVYVFTLDDQCKNLSEGLDKTKRLKCAYRTVFYGVHEKHVPTVKNYLTSKQRTIEESIFTYFYALDQDIALNYTIDYPSGFAIRNLQRSNAKQIDDIWPHKYQGSDQYIAGIIESNGGYGVFTEKDNRMVAWVIRQVYGLMGMLQVEKDYGGKGLGSLLIRILSQELAKNGDIPAVTVVGTNKIAQHMFEKLQFRKVGSCEIIILDD